MSSNENILSGPPQNVKLPKDLSLGQFLLDQLRNHSSLVAQVNAETGEEQKYQTILEDSQKLAARLSADGLKAGDVVSICSENNLRFCIPVCATLYLGATNAPLNPMYSEREFLHALNIFKSKYIFVSPLVAARLQEVVKKLPWTPKLVLLVDFPNIKLPSMNDLIRNAPKMHWNKFRAAQVDPKTSTAAILCSSGTTGLAKGVMLTDSNILTVITHLADPAFGKMEKEKVVLGLLPYFHAYAFLTMIVTLSIGTKTVVLSRFEEKSFLEAIQKYKVQHLTLVPPLMVFLAKHPLVSRYDLSSVKDVWCGAAPLSEEIQNIVTKRLNIPRIRQGYGLTETTLGVLMSPKDVTKFDSVGKLAPGTQGKVVGIAENNFGKALGPNCEGELCFRGDLIMKGYCGDVSATAATVDKDGWIHTGDVGYYDKDGLFYIVDRLKELIKYKGFQVPPAELEAVLLAHPGVKDTAVIGLPDEEAGELPLAFVVKQPGANITAQEIVKFVNERVSTQKRLRGGVRFLEEIPKTASGKILRRNLRDILKSKL